MTSDRKYVLSENPISDIPSDVLNNLPEGIHYQNGKTPVPKTISEAD